MRYCCIFFDALSRSVDTPKMSRIQLVDLDTSSDKDDAGSVLISKHKIRTRFRWWNPIGTSHIKQEIQETDVSKDIMETQKTVHVSQDVTS